MATEKTKNKEVPSLRQTVGKEIFGNAIVVTIIVLCSWGLTFGFWGPAKDIGTFIGYIACMIPFFTVMQSYVPIILKRAELGHGKWELKDGEMTLPVEPVANIWILMLPRALLYGFGSMIFVLILIILTGWQPTPLLTALIVLFVTLITTTTLLKEYLPRHLISYAAAMKENNDSKPQPLSGYIMVEHAIPFIILQGYINFCVMNRAFPFEATKAGVSYVPSKALLPDAFIIFVLLALIQWMFSNALTRGDVRLGKVSADKLKHISGWTALGLVFGAGIIVTVAYGFILFLGRVPGLSIEMAKVFKISILILSVIFGAWIGVRWGGSREYALLEER